MIGKEPTHAVKSAKVVSFTSYCTLGSIVHRQCVRILAPGQNKGTSPVLNTACMLYECDQIVFIWFSYYRFRMCRWWTMNALNGVGSLRVGSYEWKRKSETEVQKDVRAYRVADLPNIANVSYIYCGLRKSASVRLKTCINFAFNFSTTGRAGLSRQKLPKRGQDVEERCVSDISRPNVAKDTNQSDSGMHGVSCQALFYMCTEYII